VLHLRCGFFFTNLLFDPDSLRNGVVRVAAAVEDLTLTRVAGILTLRPLLRAESSGEIVVPVP
jgi:hypothetical protein